MKTFKKAAGVLTIVLIACENPFAGRAVAQEVTPLWLQEINGAVNVAGSDKLPILIKPVETVIAQPSGVYREGREGIYNFARLIPYSPTRILLAIMENGIDEVTADAAQLALAAQYPDRSLIWLDAATSRPLGIAWQESFFPADLIGYDVTAPDKGYQASKNYALWRPALDENPDPAKRAIYSGYKHLILRYAPKANGTGWETTPTIAWEEPVPGLNGDGSVSPAGGIGDGLSGTSATGGEGGSWRSFRWRNIRVTGFGANTVICAGGGTWRIGSHPQAFGTVNGVNFVPFARLNDRSGGARNGFSLGGTSSRIVTTSADARRPNLQMAFHGHYPGTGWEARPNRYTSNPDKPIPGPEYNQQPGVRLFNQDEAAAGGLPAFTWEAAGKDGLPLNRGVDGVDRYDGNWNMSLDTNPALDYIVAVASSSYDVNFFTKGWLAVHRLDGSISSGNSAYQLPFQEDDVQVDYGGSVEADFSATEAWVQVVPDLTAAPNLKKSLAYVSLENGGFGVFSIQNVPATLVSSPGNQTVQAGDDTIFTAQVSGSPNDFQWYHNGRPLPATAYFKGVKKEVLTITGATPADAGVYQLKWTNPINGAGQTAAATLTVTGDFVRWTAAREIPPRTVDTTTLESSLDEGANSFTLHAGGLGAFDVLVDGLSTGDNQYFRYESLTGDFDKKVRLAGLTSAPDLDKYARAGLLLRQSLEPAAPTLEIAAANPDPGGNNFVRVAGRGYPKQIYSARLGRTYAGVDVNLPNQWLRVRRVGNAFAFFVSPDGNTWSTIAEQYQVFPSTVLFGTFANTDNAAGTSMATAEFANYGDVVATDTLPPQLLSVGTIDLKTIGVKFSEPVDSTTATMFANYALSQGSVTGARVGIGGNTVYLDIAGLSSAVFSVTVNGIVDLAGNAVAAGSRADGKKSNWISTDIGYIQDANNRPILGDDPYVVGQAVAVSSEMNPELEIVGGGSNAYNPGDFMHYLYRPYTGDFDVAVAVDRFDRRGIAGGYANAGFHIRAALYREDNTAPGEITKVPSYVNITYYEASDPNRAAIELNRANPGDGYGNSGPFDNNFMVGGIKGFFPAVRALDAAGTIEPASDRAEAKWLRVKRVGQDFTSFFSYDGVNWQEQGGSTRTMTNLPETVLVGFGNHNDSGYGVSPNSTYAGNGTLDENGKPAQNASNYGVVRIRAIGDYVEPVPVTQLGLRPNGPYLGITWPGVGRTLEQSASLAPGSWTDSPAWVEGLSGINTASVLPVKGQKLFFRLKEQ